MKTKTTPGTITLPAKFILAASTDKTREILNGILIDAENRAVVATNGRALVTVPIPGTATIQPGYITPELWKSATIMAKKGPVILDYTGGTISGLPYLPADEKGIYPEWKQVLSEDTDPVFRTRLDPQFLLNCAIALGFNPESAPHKGITLDFDAKFDTPIRIRVADHAHGVIMPMGDDRNTAGHGLRIATTQPERSPAPASSSHSSLLTRHSALGTSSFDRSAILADPIAWLRKVDDALRYIKDFTPHGNYIYDYLTIGEIAKDVEHMKEERDKAMDTRDSDAEEIKSLKTLLENIVEELTPTFTDAKSLIHALEQIGSLINAHDNDIHFNYSKLSEQLDELFEDLTTPKTEDDFESMRAERDQYRDESAAAITRILAMEKELTQSRNRITALETAAKHRQAIDQHAATTKPERSPASSRSTIHNPQSSASPIISRNEPRNGIELRFPGKPDDATRDALKTHGFRWAPGQPDKPWIAKYTEERWVFATALAEGTTPTPIPQETEDPTNLTPEPPTPQSEIGNQQSTITTPIPSAFDLF